MEQEMKQGNQVVKEQENEEMCGESNSVSTPKNKMGTEPIKKMMLSIVAVVLMVSANRRKLQKLQSRSFQ